MYDSHRKISSSESRKQSTDESSRIAAFNKYDYPLNFDSLPQVTLQLYFYENSLIESFGA